MYSAYLVPGIGGPAPQAAGTPPVWSFELTAWATLAVAVAAVAVAAFTEWRASVRVRTEREHSDKILAEERRLADERLRTQMEHSDKQFRQQQATTQLQLLEERGETARQEQINEA